MGVSTLDGLASRRKVHTLDAHIRMTALVVRAGVMTGLPATIG